MNNKKILLSFLLVVLIAISLGAVSAEDVDSDSDAISVVSGNTWTPDSSDAPGIQKAVDSASSGDTVDLSAYTNYDVGNKTVTVNGKDNLIIRGNGNTIITGTGGVGQGKQATGAIFSVSNSKGVIFEGINFIDVRDDNNVTYGGSVNGCGIEFKGAGALGGTVDNCYFKDFNQAVSVSSCDNITIKNSEFHGGYATKLINDPTVNSEEGSKVISVGGSFFTTIVNNIFDGPVLDAISIAKSSGDAKIIGNTFKNNAYSIFFGGASTDGTYIKDNTFINCGAWSGVVGNETVFWTGFPVISIQKASSGVFIDNNTFEVVNGNWLIAAEQGNTAHGYPSTLGNINVTNNVIKKYDSAVNPDGVTLLHILCRSGTLNPYAPITITGNTLVAGVKPLVVWNKDWGDESGSPTNIIIPAADLVQTQIAISEIAQDGIITAVLKDINGKGIAAEAVSYTINGENQTNLTTDKNGEFTIAGIANSTIVISFAKTSKYAESSASITLPAKAERIETGITITNATAKAYSKGKVYIRLYNVADNTPLANKSLVVKVDGPTKNLTTDENGTAILEFSYKIEGTHYATAIYLGDDAAQPSVASSVIKVEKISTSLSNPTKTYKVKNTKKITLFLKGDKALSGKKVTLSVNGKTYTGKTGSNGKVTFTLNINKKGTFQYTAKFEGDRTYAAKTVKGTIKVN